MLGRHGWSGASPDRRSAVVFPFAGKGSRILSCVTTADVATHHQRLPLRAALVGSGVWLAWATLFPASPVHTLVSLSPLVLHPLVMRLSALDGPPSLPWRIATWGQLPAAVLLAVGFTVSSGTGAGALSLPWLIVCFTTAGHAVLRRRRLGLRPTGGLLIDIGLLLLPIGGLWATASCLGLQPLGTNATLTLLTAAHFHYAGFVLPVLAGLTAMRLGDRRWTIAGLVAVAGVVLVAAGINASPALEVVGAFVLTLGAIGVAVGQVAVARDTSLPFPTMLFALSSASLLYSMSLASIYAWTEFRGAAWPAIPAMVELHGTLQALGTCLMGVWAWTIQPPEPS